MRGEAGRIQHSRQIFMGAQHGQVALLGKRSHAGVHVWPGHCANEAKTTAGKFGEVFIDFNQRVGKSGQSGQQRSRDCIHGALLRTGDVCLTHTSLTAAFTCRSHILHQVNNELVKCVEVLCRVFGVQK